MAKGEQRSNKMAKKPKKDTSPPKEHSASDRPMPPVTTVMPKGKEKTGNPPQCAAAPKGEALPHQ